MPGFLANLTTDRLLGCVLLCVSACCILGNFYVAFKSSKATQLKAIDAAAKGTHWSIVSQEGESILSRCSPINFIERASYTPLMSTNQQNH